MIFLYDNVPKVQLNKDKISSYPSYEGTLYWPLIDIDVNLVGFRIRVVYQWWGFQFEFTTWDVKFHIRSQVLIFES